MFNPVGRAYPQYQVDGIIPRRSSIVSDTITAVAVSIFATMGANSLQYSSPGVSALLRLVPLAAGTIWLLKRFSSNQPRNPQDFQPARQAGFNFNPFNWFPAGEQYARPVPAFNRPCSPVFMPEMPVNRPLYFQASQPAHLHPLPVRRHVPQNGPLPVQARQAPVYVPPAQQQALPVRRHVPQNGPLPVQARQVPAYVPPAVHHALPVTRQATHSTRPPAYVPPAAEARPLPVARAANVTQAGKPLFALPARR